MPETQMTVVRSGLPLPTPAPGELVVSDDELRRWVLNGSIVGRLQRFQVARLVTERLSTSGRPMLAWALRLLARRRSYIVDCLGHERDLTLQLLVRWSWQLAREALGREELLRGIEREVDALAAGVSVTPHPRLDRTATPLYLRTDLSFGVRAGGSVGHIAGVINELGRELGPPVLLTTDPVPTVRPDVDVRHVPVPERFWNFRELPSLVLNDVVDAEAAQVAVNRRLGLVYQRYSLNNYAGLRVARRAGVPFVLEYNGSEIWMSRHWHRPLKYEALAERIELLNINHADLVVVVSGAMRDELVARGAFRERILVNANAVDPERYRPDIDGAAIRHRYNLEGQTVVGFIGTYQPWHGAEPLARAFAILMRDRPELRDRVRLLMVGTGPSLATVKQIIRAASLDDLVRYTGLVAQEDGPQHLAACDILASPHVPNPDGTPFFGSPTKVFEYMAMGRGIVASDLDQIGEVLRHRETAWLVPPDDPDGLARGLARLVDDPALRASLGEAARRDALANHTWRAHVRRTIAALEARLGAGVA
jgi:glycosyltransferase involved in cell wall biosynthesis